MLAIRYQLRHFGAHICRALIALAAFSVFSHASGEAIATAAYAQRAIPDPQVAGMADSKARALQTYGKVPLSFEPNRGQVDSQVQFLSRGQGYALYLTPGEAVLQLQKPTAKEISLGKDGRPVPQPAPESSTLRMSLVGADAKAAVAGQQPLPGTVNYFSGSDASKWHTALPTYQRVSYKAVYPGVDLVYYGNQRELEYDFVVAPGADAGKIALNFAGATPRIDAAGDLVLAVSVGETRFHKPVVYQMDGDRRATVEAGYQIAAGQVKFALGGYDHAKALVIDPVLSYLTYIGGSANDLITGIAIDSAGSAYVVARSFSLDYPLKNAYQSTSAGTVTDSRNSAIAVSKFNATGTALVYSTFLNGASSSLGYGIAVDSGGNAYVGGYTSSNDYPVTAGAYLTYCGNGYQSQTGGGIARVGNCGVSSTSGVLTKLNPTGTALAYSTFLGGDNGNVITAVAVDSADQAYVTGYSNANCGPGPYSANGGCQAFSNFPITTGSAQDSANQNGVTGGNTFAFLTKFNAAGNALLYSSILGNSGPTSYTQGAPQGHAVAVDASGNAYIGGVASTTLYTTAGAYQTSIGTLSGVRAFAAKFDTVAQKFIYSTYISGTDNTSNVGEQVNGIAADSSGNAYLAGATSQCTFPTTAGAYQVQASYPPGTTTSCNAGFVMKLNPTGTAPVWSTFLGNNPAPANNSTQLYGITLGSDGSVYVAGQAFGYGYPVLNPVVPQTNTATAPVITRLNSAGSAILFSTTLSGTDASSDSATGIAVDGSGNIYIAGQTDSFTLPVTAGAFQTANRTPGGNTSTGFVAKIAPTVTTTTTLTLPTGAITAGQSVTFSAKVAGQAGSTGAPTGTVTFLSGSTTLGTGSLDTTGSTSYTAPGLNATTYNVTASYAGDNAFSASVSAAQSLVVVAPIIVTTTTLAASPTTAVQGASVALTATVAPASGAAATGAVTFLEGTTTLGTGTLDATGAATFSTTALATGAHSITASYAGTATDAASTSSAVSVTVTAPPPADFTLALAPATGTIAAGASASSTVSVTPANGFVAATALTCSGLPANATCSFSPATVTPNGTAAVSSTLKISTNVTAATASNVKSVQPPLALAGLFAGFLFLPLLGRKNRQVRQMLSVGFMLVAATIVMAGMSGCGSDHPKPAPTPVTAVTPAGTYTVTVTGTAGATTHSAAYTLVVQ
jgi:Bacterial Ig-like domain (group 3)/Beta-propeller repeat